MWAVSGSLAGREGLLTNGKVLWDAFENPWALHGSVTVCGFKYMALRCDLDALRGKKGQCGVAVCRSKTAMVIALYDDPTKTPPQALSAAQWLAADLSAKNY